MYSLRDYGSMLRDSGRLQAYSQAIDHAVRPGDAVLEIGCGPGVFSLLACRAGARKVYAIDYDPIVYLARKLAEANGVSDRISFLELDSRKAELPEPVNVIVADVRGALPLFDSAISIIEDARTRFLAPNGIMIPQRDILKVALISADEYYESVLSPWREAVPQLDLSPAATMILSSEFYHAYFSAEQLVSDPQTWCLLNYQDGATVGAEGCLHFCVTRNGTTHGLCVWFEAELSNGFGYSTGPGTPKTGISGQMFLPWPHKISLTKGQAVEVSLRANFVNDHYIWQWETKIAANHFGPAWHFKQSTLQGAVLSPESLRRRAADFVPKLSEAGEADRWLLQAIDGKASLQQIAQAAAQRFPKVFPRWEDALRRAADLAAEFSR